MLCAETDRAQRGTGALCKIELKHSVEMEVRRRKKNLAPAEKGDYKGPQRQGNPSVKTPHVCTVHTIVRYQQFFLLAVASPVEFLVAVVWVIH